MISVIMTVAVAMCNLPFALLTKNVLVYQTMKK